MKGDFGKFYTSMFSPQVKKQNLLPCSSSRPGTWRGAIVAADPLSADHLRQAGRFARRHGSGADGGIVRLDRCPCRCRSGASKCCDALHVRYTARIPLGWSPGTGDRATSGPLLLRQPGRNETFLRLSLPTHWALGRGRKPRSPAHRLDTARIGAAGPGPRAPVVSDNTGGAARAVNRGRLAGLAGGRRLGGACPPTATQPASLTRPSLSSSFSAARTGRPLAATAAQPRLRPRHIPRLRAIWTLRRQLVDTDPAPMKAFPGSRTPAGHPRGRRRPRRCLRRMLGVRAAAGLWLPELSCHPDAPLDGASRLAAEKRPSATSSCPGGDRLARDPPRRHHCHLA